MTQTIRHDWSKAEIAALYEQPLLDLLLRAQQIHRQFFPPNQIQPCILLNIKTGACPEDCSYCAQRQGSRADLKKEKLFALDPVIAAAKQAKQQGAARFCMGAAWRRPPATAMPRLQEMIAAVKALGLETCVTLGSLSQQQAQALKQAGLDYYNHNLDTSPEYYPKIITTRHYQERLQTLQHVRQAGIKVCCGGILGLGESRADRVSLFQQLANLPQHPHSVPINRLLPVPGTPLGEQEFSSEQVVDNFEFVRSVAVARTIMPRAFVRLSAGRINMNPEMQALCFMAGANSIFLGDRLLTQQNNALSADETLMQQLGLTAMAAENHE